MKKMKMMKTILKRFWFEILKQLSAQMKHIDNVEEMQMRKVQYLKVLLKKWHTKTKPPNCNSGTKEICNWKF